MKPPAPTTTRAVKATLSVGSEPPLVVNIVWRVGKNHRSQAHLHTQLNTEHWKKQSYRINDINVWYVEGVYHKHQLNVVKYIYMDIMKSQIGRIYLSAYLHICLPSNQYFIFSSYSHFCNIYPRLRQPSWTAIMFIARYRVRAGFFFVRGRRTEVWPLFPLRGLIEFSGMIGLLGCPRKLVNG